MSDATKAGLDARIAREKRILAAMTKIAKVLQPLEEDERKQVLEALRGEGS